MSKAILPIIILVIAAMLYGLGGLLGPRIGPGWDNILEGIAMFVGIAGMALGAGRLSRALGKPKSD